VSDNTSFCSDLDLESRFRNLQPEALSDDLIAEWTTPERGLAKPWDLQGAAEKVRVNFESLVKSAALEMGHPDEASAVDFWLDLLRRDSPAYEASAGETPTLESRRRAEIWRAERQSFKASGECDPLAGTEDPLDGETRAYEIGRIRRVCEASADYCLKLASEMRRRRLTETKPTEQPSDEVTGRDAAPDKKAAAKERSERRMAVLNPLMRVLHLNPNKLATKAGCGKGSAYEYCNGKRAWIKDEVRSEIATVLKIKVDELPQ
jgi:hypothetical protein